MATKLTKKQLESIDVNQIENFRYLKGQFEKLSPEKSQTMNIKIISPNGETNWIIISTGNQKELFRVLLEAKNLVKGA